MAHFAEIIDNQVVQVLVVPDEQEHRGQEYLSDELGLGGTWIQTSYHGRIRKNYAGLGYTYREDLDAFIPPKPSNALGFDEETCLWIVPEAHLEP